MTVTTIEDQGQVLGSPRGRLLGIIDTQAEFDAVVNHLSEAGFAEMEAIRGDDGVALLERVDGFFFSDMEERVLDRHIAEVKAGHIIIAIKVPSERVDEAVKIATEHGARRLVYFGPMAITWLTK